MFIYLLFVTGIIVQRQNGCRVREGIKPWKRSCRCGSSVIPPYSSVIFFMALMTKGTGDPL